MSHEVEIYLPAAEPVGAVRGSWGLTVDGPLAVEPEDVPVGVAARVLGASVVYLVSVDAAAAVPVWAWAKRVARAHRGGVWGPQTEEAWSAAGSTGAPARTGAAPKTCPTTTNTSSTPRQPPGHCGMPMGDSGSRVGTRVA